MLLTGYRSWLKRLGVNTLYIEPGRPWENGYIGSFNGKLSDELLDQAIFDRFWVAKALVGRWRRGYIHTRPHMSLDYRTPGIPVFAPKNTSNPNLQLVRKWG